MAGCESVLMMTRWHSWSVCRASRVDRWTTLLPGDVLVAVPDGTSPTVGTGHGRRGTRHDPGPTWTADRHRGPPQGTTLTR